MVAERRAGLFGPSGDLSRLVTFVERATAGRVVTGLRPLSGGIASDVFAVTVDVAGRRRRVVVRRYRPGMGVEPGPPSVAREAATLAQLEGLPIAAPLVLGADATGEDAGSPALVMTRCRGRIDLRPSDPVRWAGALAETLASIHTLDVDAPTYESWLDLARLEVPAWTRRPGLWRDATDLLATSTSPEPTGLVHGDFQQFNVLWSDGAVSGVLDWTGSWSGPPDADVAHARLNLACLYDAALAESFRRSYEVLAGRPTSAWRDVAELVGYDPSFATTLRVQVGRRMRLDVQGMTDRVEELLALSLARA